MPITLSIVIPTFNRCGVLLRCLSHLNKQTVKDFEVIVVDDGSTDDTEQKVARFHVDFPCRLIHQENQGPAAARNRGVSAAAGKLLLFLDDDLMATPDLVRQHILSHERFADAVLYGPIPISDESDDSALVQYQRELWQTDIERINRWGLELRDLSVSANTSVPADFFKKTGGYDASLRSEGDEFELAMRMLQLGARFRWNQDAVAHQLWVKSEFAFSGAGQHRRAINEKILLTKYPAYRALSRISGLFLGRYLDRKKRQWLARHPELVLAVGSSIQRISMLLPKRLRLRAEIASLRAYSAASFWSAFKRECGNPFQLEPHFDKRVVILMYHLVRDDIPSGDVVISTKKFERHLLYLKNQGYQGITLNQWYDWVFKATPLPEKPIIITFDDGFLDTYQNAWPLLKKYGFRFTVFLVSGKLGTVNSWDGLDPGKLPLMTVEQVQEMAASGVEFHAHSSNHHDLTKLNDSLLNEEITRGFDELKKVTGRVPEFFAYPYGLYRSRERKAVWESGYRGACTVEQGRNDLTTDFYRLKRINIAGTDLMPDFILKAKYGAGILSKTYLKETIKALLRQELRLFSSEKN